MFSKLPISGLLISFILGGLVFNLAFYLTFKEVSNAWVSLILIGGLSFSLSFFAGFALKKILQGLSSNRNEA